MEIGDIAEALYEKFTADEKQKVIDMFRSMDVNGDGTITLSEYTRFLDARGNAFNPELFTIFDKDNNGCLDFKEFITLHFMYITKKFIICEGGCGSVVTGDYFSCSLCFHSEKDYNLCFYCYKNSNVSMLHCHSADVFLDNQTLLQFSRNTVLEMQKEKTDLIDHLIDQNHQLMQSRQLDEQKFVQLNKLLIEAKSSNQSKRGITAAMIATGLSIGSSALTICSLM